jgi:hypothetical protein
LPPASFLLLLLSWLRWVFFGVVSVFRALAYVLKGFISTHKRLFFRLSMILDNATNERGKRLNTRNHNGAVSLTRGIA